MFFFVPVPTLSSSVTFMIPEAFCFVYRETPVRAARSKIFFSMVSSTACERR